MSESKTGQADQYKGWLYKWTNYLKGYQKRWFVLQNGLLSYYRNQAEMAHTCRGTINLANAFIHTEDSCSFVISNGGTQSFHLKASSEVERQRWVTALELAKAKAVSLMESAELRVFPFDSSDDDEEESHSQPDKNELQNTLRTLSAKLEDLSTCNDLITKHGVALQRSLSELEQLDNPSATRVKEVNERATLFRITSNAMINACHDYLDLAQSQGKRWQKMLQYEHEQRLRLEEMVEQLAKQHSSFEKMARRSLAAVAHPGENSQTKGMPGISDDEEDDFFDAVDEQTEEFKVCLPPDKTHRRTGSGISVGSLGANIGNGDNYYNSDSEDSDRGSEAKVISAKKPVNNEKKHKRSPSQDSYKEKDGALNSQNTVAKISKTPRKRRTRVPEKPNYSINLWSIMKNCIGKELTKIPMPVNFSEPTSMLQRLTEEYEYSDCLDKAALTDDSCEQLAYVAAFTVSAYASSLTRTGKPFNPLLGETYECDRRDDYGWRSFTEQVSHHPPMLASHAEGRGWVVWQEFTMSSKFRGKYLQIIPLGITHLLFPKSGNHYTWRKVSTTVHNIIVGKLWVDNHGEMDITNHKTGDNCHLKYNAYSYFSREPPRKVTGVITNSAGTARFVLQGTWDERIEGAKVLNTTEAKGKTVFETGHQKCLWQKRPSPPELEKLYNFTQFAVELNEPEEGVAPTDSRLRPDQRLMEDGQWDDANKYKLLLEEKQRTVRRKREAEAAEAASQGKEYPAYSPVWFKKEVDSTTGNLMYVFTNEYWQCKEERDWSKCPDIFL